MTLHLEGKLKESVMEPATSSVFCESAGPIKCCPRSGSPSLLENMTCVKVAGRALNVGLCSPHHSSSFHHAARVVEEEFYFAAWEQVRRILINSSSRLPADHRHNLPWWRAETCRKTVSLTQFYRWKVQLTDHNIPLLWYFSLNNASFSK